MLKFSTDRVLVVGLGLIGGSLARALRARGLVTEVVGFDLNRSECELGVSLGVIDRIGEDLLEEVRRADLVVLAVPVKVMEQVLEQIRPALRDNTLLTDVGSTKSNLVATARHLFTELPAGFVPGHPIAGAEKSGVGASDEALFVRRKVILTPLPESDPQATLAIARLWQAVGAEVLQMEVQRHDEVLAATSHLPHLLAFSLVDTLAHEAENTDIFRYAAGGFRDFTRIAASDPTMWHDICFANRDQLLVQIDRFTQGVGKLREAIASGESEQLLGIFTRAKAAREHFSRLLARSAYAPDVRNQTLTFYTRPAGALTGSISVPGDRSISHRAVMIAALAEGVTDIEGFLEGEDSLATLQAFRDLGVVIEGPHQGRVRVFGVGLKGLRPPVGPLYMGGSGTTMRLLCGVLAAQAFSTSLEADQLLSEESMMAVLEPLRQLGAEVESETGAKPPLRIAGNAFIEAPDTPLQTDSAQVKSALLLAGLYSSTPTVITQALMTRDHTERMLSHFGCKLQCNENVIELSPMQRPQATRLSVPGDVSLAFYYVVAAAITPGSDLTLEHVGCNPTRTALIELLQLMGADIRWINRHDDCAEPVADLRVCYAPLKGIDIPGEYAHAALDECAPLLVAACFAAGETRLMAPSDQILAGNARLQLMIDALVHLGGDCEIENNQLSVRPGPLTGGEVSSGGDARVAMALSVAGQRTQGPLKITACAGVGLYCPDFVEQARRVGMELFKEED